MRRNRGVLQCKKGKRTAQRRREKMLEPERRSDFSRRRKESVSFLPRDASEVKFEILPIRLPEMRFPEIESISEQFPGLLEILSSMQNASYNAMPCPLAGWGDECPICDKLESNTPIKRKSAPMRVVRFRRNKKQ